MIVACLLMAFKNSLHWNIYRWNGMKPRMCFKKFYPSLPTHLLKEEGINSTGMANIDDY